MEKIEWSLQQLIAKSETYCANAEHCVSEVKNKLRLWGATQKQIEQILELLIQQKYIDEKRYVAAVVHDKLSFQGWGRTKIRLFLQSKYIPSSYIDQALNAIDDEEYKKILERVIASKKRSLKTSDLQSKNKLIRFCLQRGFTYEEIHQLL